MATDDATTITNLESCFDASLALARDLNDDEWSVQSLCPDWNMHGVIAHLAAIEHMLDGWQPTSLDDALPFALAGEFMQQAASMSGAELTDHYAGLLDNRRSQLGAMSAEQLAGPSQTPVGPGTYGRFMGVRVFDFWVHHRDMTLPLARESDDGGPAAEQSLDEVHNSMGYIAGKKIGLTDGMSMTVNLTGPIERDIHVAVDGRAGVVESLDSPDIVLTADSTTFIMLACGRIDPQTQVDEGKISWSGDDEWGHKAATSLRFTM